jgi:hypothetical protein
MIDRTGAYNNKYIGTFEKTPPEAVSYPSITHGFMVYGFILDTPAAVVE